LIIINTNSTGHSNDESTGSKHLLLIATNGYLEESHSHHASIYTYDT